MREMKINRKFFILWVAVVLAIALFFSLKTVFAAWQEPAGDPPTQNVSAPINVSSQSQAKTGGLTVGSATLGSFTLFSAGTLGVQGAATLQSTLNVQQAATFQNTVNVQGAADFDNTVNIDGQLDSRGSLRSYDGAETRFWVDNASNKVLVNSSSTAPDGALLVTGGAANGIYVTSSSRRAIEATSSASLYPTISASQTDPGTIADRGIALYGQGPATGNTSSRYSYGVYGDGGDVSGNAAGTRLSYGVYGQAGDVTTGTYTTATYGVYGRSGAEASGFSYAGYFAGKTKICGQTGYAIFGTRDQAGVFSQDGVYFSQDSPLMGSQTIPASVPAREDEKRTLRVNNGLYLGYTGWSSDLLDEHPGNIIMHDRQRPDHVYRIEVIDSVLTATRVSSCVEGLYCQNLATVVRERWNGTNGVGAGCVDPPQLVQICSNDTPRCLNGSCVTRCEYEGYFCDQQGSPSCGSVMVGAQYSCGGGGMVCCTGT